MIKEFVGKDKFSFRFAVVLKDFAQCVKDVKQVTKVKFNGTEDPTGAPFVIFKSNGGSSGGTKWYLWIGGFILVAGLLVGGFMYWKSRGSDGSYTLA